jgi:hypothetical protein
MRGSKRRINLRLSVLAAASLAARLSASHFDRYEWVGGFGLKKKMVMSKKMEA